MSGESLFSEPGKGPGFDPLWINPHGFGGGDNSRREPLAEAAHQKVIACPTAADPDRIQSTLVQRSCDAFNREFQQGALHVYC